MAGSVNRVTIVGNLGQDPEVRYTTGGTAVATVSVATSEAWKDKSGDKQERTEWHRIVFWDRMAEIAQEYLRKGSKVYVEGSLQTRKYTDKQGIERYTTEIRGRELVMLGDGGRRGRDDDEPREGRSQGRGRQQESAPPPEFDDDIPF